MCGIFGAIGVRDAANVVLEGLKKLEYRGYDSWGIACATAEKLLVEKHVGKIGSASTALPTSSIALGHTRWATHGGVTQENAHPHLDCSYTLALVHNGIVENYEELKASLAKTHTFRSQTDTEVLIHCIEELAKQYPLAEAVRRAFRKAKGLNACIVLSARDQQLIAIKNGSPLILGIGKKHMFIASDAASLAPHTKRVVFLADGEMAEVSRDGVKVRSLNGARKALRVSRIPALYEEAELGTYIHFMLKEIHEQPKVLTNLLTRTDHTFAAMASEVQKSGTPLFIGCGTAYYMSLAATYLFARLAGRQAQAVQGNECASIVSLFPKSTFPVCISQSGETIDIIEPVKMLKKRGMRVGALVNCLGSTLARIANRNILLRAGPEICVASTKASTAMLGALVLLAAHAGKREAEGKRMLAAAIAATERLLSPQYAKKHIAPVVRVLQQHQHLFVLGRGLSYPVALEAALKIKEITYLHAEGFAGGELKHGVIALIEKGTPCIVFAPADEHFAESMSNAMEVRARGGLIIGVAAKNNPAFDMWLPVGEVADAKEATVIPNVVVSQLLAYYLGVALGREIDKPRNLAKSVTVK